MAQKQKISAKKNNNSKTKKSFKVSKSSSRTTASKVIASNSLDLADIINAAAIAGKGQKGRKQESKSTMLQTNKMQEDIKKDKEMINNGKEETQKTQNLLDKLDLL
ncbi:unnamed protein product [Cyberlindnera jadinii]|uniref:Uncharacterized protein n=1 Tax=Cyberlindnera jadinii (strain ATCC 18201 / CBS 1600 / BCRC 20928 / JCM 3617 / NBRC 0987 / NRRL Y-1542) TaxID=983966 RepID=A0A0H5C1F0_CYBJN|nr:hypothetical protein CYBJADRAFT_161548 [Cyberlindnera jadinii NRRL Y-1542]ODV75076.1 hypothetical protein CYBJADRAFT_161548 [Cyberlindnera jadinii NRRL Y-1542]CEP21287.1 unnamed protein product [Cyberlindnera jadinii]